ncbi:NUDIX hydrolase [Mesobacterium pallidum]|uniref:NUDIX hydrolase n=1 Tax=Mesobacterium pallidum TaxID=2872037 RepID=UPI001EE303C3|nr:NUDIX hydrolase [Mesobacterium pallidum]
MHLPRQRPISTYGAGKSDVRVQFGALCYRIKDGKTEVLMVTSRSRRRWIVPKGWPMENKTPGQAAEIEAWEEAGVRGQAVGPSLGVYSYGKIVENGVLLPCVVMLYPVKVDSLADSWPEKHERKRRWMGRKKAARKTDDPDLAYLIRNFDPRKLRRA